MGTYPFNSDFIFFEVNVFPWKWIMQSPAHFTDKTEDTMTLDSRKKDSNSVLQFFYFNGKCEIDKPYKVFLKLFYKIR